MSEVGRPAGAGFDVEDPSRIEQGHAASGDPATEAEVAAYLRRLRHELRWSPVARRRVLEEVDAHLWEALERPRGRGRSGTLDERFGTPADLAALFLRDWRAVRLARLRRTSVPLVAGMMAVLVQSHELGAGLRAVPPPRPEPASMASDVKILPSGRDAALDPNTGEVWPLLRLSKRVDRLARTA